MVQQIVTSSQPVDHEPSLVGLLLATDDVIPNDEDTDDMAARDEWVVRELERLLYDWDQEQERSTHERERARRRTMTNAERRLEDSQQQLPPPSNLERPRPAAAAAGQRFFHRGAFYMDESEWDESDVRSKAVEYAQAATGTDKTMDRRQLPKVMQVKKFGFANQSKYKGLAAEDTTDKHREILPLKPRK
jgi:microfibrillar-associated protein 1